MANTIAYLIAPGFLGAFGVARFMASRVSAAAAAAMPRGHRVLVT